MQIEQVAVIVDDYDEAIAFFVDVLGFELVEDSPALTDDGRAKRWVVVRPPGAATALLLARADGERQAAAVGDQFAGRVGLFLRVDDFEASYERMRDAGVVFLGTPRDEPYGRVVVFADVAGNRWDLLGPRRRSLDAVTTYRLAGVEVPRIGLGTNRLTTASEHVSFIRDAVAAGVRHVDTAHLYTGGDSERAVGEALERADDVLVATKGGYRAGEGRPDVLGAQIEQSLRSLRTEAIGLYYLHRVDPETPLEESLGAIASYVDRGAIRHVGVSEVSVEQIERARQIVPIAAVQNRYNLGDREHDDVVDFCEREGIAFVPYYPLGGEGGPGLARTAERVGVTENAVRLAWLLRRSPAILPIPGTLSLEHLRENLAALEVDLGEADDIAA